MQLETIIVIPGGRGGARVVPTGGGVHGSSSSGHVRTVADVKEEECKATLKQETEQHVGTAQQHYQTCMVEVEHMRTVYAWINGVGIVLCAAMLLAIGWVILAMIFDW